MYHFVERPMNYKDRASNVRSIVDVCKLVARHGESEIKSDSVRTKQRRLQNNSTHTSPLPSRLGRQVARRARTERAAIKDNLFRSEMSHFRQVLESSFDIGVAVLFGRSARAFPVACVVVCHDVDPQDFGEVIEPVKYHAQVFRIAVAKEQCDICVLSFDKEGWDSIAVACIEPDMH